jgi:uncharacterized glyoxalase superfamily protein PhnB
MGSGPQTKSYVTPSIPPYLLYDDLRGAFEWLAKAFGFRLRHSLPDRNVTHVQMEFWGVSDLDNYFERFVRAGAVVLEKPAERPYGDGRYGVADPEGHRWYFAEEIGHGN